MPCCSVKFCKNWNGNSKSKNIKFFTFPKDPDLAKEWIKRCDLVDKIHNLKDRMILCFLYDNI